MADRPSRFFRVNVSLRKRNFPISHNKSDFLPIIELDKGANGGFL